MILDRFLMALLATPLMCLANLSSTHQQLNNKGSLSSCLLRMVAHVSCQLNVYVTMFPLCYNDYIVKYNASSLHFPQELQKKVIGLQHHWSPF